jgi:hypothetical protein
MHNVYWPPPRGYLSWRDAHDIRDRADGEPPGLSNGPTWLNAYERSPHFITLTSRPN